MSIKKRLRHWLSVRSFYGIIPYADISRLPVSEGENYLADVKYLLESPALRNETNRLKEQAATAIIRHTKTDEETAYHRGVLVGIESLRKRLELLAAMDKKP